MRALVVAAIAPEVERQELVLGFEATFGARRPRDGASRSGPTEDDP